MLALLVGACTDQFEKYNTNPIQISDKSLTQDFNHVGAYYPNMLYNLFGHQCDEDLLHDNWVRHTGTPTAFCSGVNNTTYVMTWYGDYWNRIYDNVMAASFQVKKIAKAGNYDVFYQWAKLIEVMGLSKVTSYYGPVIYSKYGSGTTAAIEYDAEKDLYNSFFADLDSVYNVFSVNTEYAGLKKFDASYAGDINKWLKAVNSLRLRLAIRLSEIDPTLAKTQGEKAIKDKFGLITANADNFMVSLYGNTMPLAVICYSWDDTRMGGAMESFMVGLKDGRISKMFAPVTDLTLVADHPSVPYKGIHSGIFINAKDERIGFSKVNESFKTATSRRAITAAEINFDLAEAALRGWDGAGDAKTNYENGVKASFADWGAAGVADYLADATSTPINYVDPKNPKNNFTSRSTITVAWNEADSKELKLEKIITQKWLDAFTNANEIWCDHRRTGYPKLPFNAKNDSNTTYGVVAANDFLRRIPFLQSEYTSNPTGVANAVNKLKNNTSGKDYINIPLYFDVNNLGTDTPSNF